MQNSLLTKGYRAAADIAAHRAVMLNSDGHVTVTTDNNSKTIGVAGEVNADSGEMTDVIHVGVAEVVLSGNVSAGNSLSPSSAGTVKTSATGHRRLGIALEDGQNGDVISALIIPVDIV